MSEHPVPSERDRRSASAVTFTGSSSGHVFEIQLGHLCNNRCLFCSSGLLTEQGLAKPVALADILAAIEQARAAGARRLVFLGGEPTLHRGFLQALERSVRVGFEEIVIFTNGVRLPQSSFVDRCLALGNFEWRISIQGADEASHVAVTGRKQSYARIVSGVRELVRRGQRVTLNMCVSARSYQSLPGYPDLVRELGVSQVHIDVIRPASTGRSDPSYLREIMPPYRVVAPYLERMLEGFEAAQLGVEVSVGNLPHCVLRSWPQAVVHGGEDTFTVSSAERGLEPGIDKYAWHATLRRHLPACAGCALAGDCTGVFEAYLELYGPDEFCAVEEAELLALPARRRPFLTLARRALADLLERADRPPAPFVLARRIDDRSARVLALTYAAGHALVTLRFESPERTGEGIWAGDGAPVVLRGPAWNLALVVDRAVRDEALAGLVGWALPQAGGEAATAAMAGWSRARQLARVRQRARRTLERLRSTPAPQGWRWDAGEIVARSLDGRAELVAPLRQRNGPGALDVVLAVAHAPGARPIELDFRRGPETDRVAAEQAIGTLVAALKRGRPER
jgi:MoaA/NifB/PqqE/SkfB family radical SAM enzyme